MRNDLVILAIAIIGGALVNKMIVRRFLPVAK